MNLQIDPNVQDYVVWALLMLGGAQLLLMRKPSLSSLVVLAACLSIAWLVWSM